MAWEYAIAAFALVQLADVLTTLRFLDRGVGEANPVIRFFMQHGGELGWIVIKLCIAALIAWGLYSFAWPWVLWVISIAYGGLIFWNMRAGR